LSPTNGGPDVQDRWERLLELVLQHKGKLAGAVIGLVISLLIIALGFLRAVFVLSCLVGGFYVGARFDGTAESPVYPSSRSSQYRRRLR
jgi:uncharacterized membrane protein